MNQHNTESAILARIAELIGIDAENLTYVPELPENPTPRQIAHHLLDAGTLQPGGPFGCWRPEPRGRWAILPTLAHLAAAVETLTGREITDSEAERIAAFIALQSDVADHRAAARLFRGPQAVDAMTGRLR